MMAAEFSIMFLLVLAAIGLLVIGGIVLLVLLLANEKTRVAGIVLLLIILLGVPILGVAAAFVLWSVRSDAPTSVQPGPQPLMDFRQFDTQPAMEPPSIKMEPAPPEPAQGSDLPDRQNATSAAEEPALDAEAPGPDAGAGPEQAPPDEPPRRQAN